MRSKTVPQLLRTAIVVGFCLLGATPAFAQTERPDSRWAPWLGCWKLLQEYVKEDNQGTSPSEPTLPAASELIVCVARHEAGPGVVMTSYTDSKVVFAKPLIADGASHPIDEPGCRGTEIARWSRDGRRLFTRAELECDGQPRRAVSGVTLLAPHANGPVWVDIQTWRGPDGDIVRVRRYQPTGESRAPGDTRALDSAEGPAQRERAVGSMTINDVIEASAAVGSAALEAALLETASRFDLNRRTLTRLDDAGVSDQVINLMVALTFPDRFRVERRRDASWSQPPPMGYYYYYLSPFAFPYWWDAEWDYAYFDTWPSGGGIVGRPVAPRGEEGRAIQGMGYTRVQSNREAVSSSGSGSTRSSSGSASGQGYSSGNSNSSSSSGSGSSSSGSMRTAQPR